MLAQFLSQLTGKKPSTAPGEVVYAIGDIHGRFDLYLKLIEAIRKDFEVNRQAKSRPRVIVLGDFIDRGPDARKLVCTLRSTQNNGAAMEVLLGNHEAILLDSVLGDEAAQRLWLSMGGLQTMESFAIEAREEDEGPHDFADRIVRAMTPGVIEWLRDRPVSVRSGDYLFCHAGVNPRVSLRRQSREDMLWIRKPFMESDRDYGAVIVHGHNIVDAVEICTNRISVDTGAYRTDVLSAVCLDGAEQRILTT